MKRIAFFGLGAMGESMATRLLQAGYAVTVVAHRSRAPVERLVDCGATEVPAPSDAAAHTEGAVLMVPAPADVEEVLFGPSGVILRMEPGYIVIDMSTGYPPETVRMASRIVQEGGHYVDAPVTGGPKGAADGTLSVMVGGSDDDVESVRPLLSALGRHVFHFGGLGAGHTAKLVQNMIGIISLAGIAEAFALASRAGLNPQLLFEMLGTSTSNSPALQYMMQKALARDFDRAGFRLDLAFKDLRLAAALGRETTLPLSTTNGATELFQVARALGFGQQDVSAVLRGLEAVLDRRFGDRLVERVKDE